MRSFFDTYYWETTEDITEGGTDDDIVVTGEVWLLLCYQVQLTTQ